MSRAEKKGGWASMERVPYTHARHCRTLYPTLQALIDTMANDNGGPFDHWVSTVSPVPFSKLEAQALTLSEEERETLVCGEDGEQRRLVKAKKLKELDAWLFAVFEGAE